MSKIQSIDLNIELHCDKPISLRLDSKILKYFVAGIKKGSFKANRQSVGYNMYTPMSIRSFQTKMQKVGIC